MELTHADREMVAEMQELLEQESRKSADKRDYDLIAQLAVAIHESTSSDDLSEVTEQNIAQIAMRSAEKSRKLHRNRWIRPTVSLAACALLCISANAWTLQALGTSLPNTIYQITKGGISFHPMDLGQSVIELEASENDPYGIRKECEKLGFSPLTPTYLPKNMKLYLKSENDAKIKDLTLTYKEEYSSKKHIQVGYTYIEEQGLWESTDYGFPCDNFNIHEEEIGGKTVLISWEDEVFHAAFCDSEEHIIYHIISNHIGYDETYKILCSYFE